MPHSPLSPAQQLRLGSLIMDHLSKVAEETAPGRGLEIACEAIELKNDNHPAFAEALKRLFSSDGVGRISLATPTGTLSLDNST